jgi:predicted phage-related endonuclease
VPPKYLPQLQHQLAVTGLDMIYYYSYDGQNNACIEVQRDQEYIDKLIEEELKFYKCMVTCTPPELSERDYNIRNDEKWKHATAYWKRSQETLKDAEFHEKKAREQMIAISESRNSKGFGVKVQKIMRQGCVDYSAIPALEGIDLNQYRKPASKSWRITLDE